MVSVRKAKVNDAKAIMTLVNNAYQIEKDGSNVAFKNCDRYLDVADVKDALQKGTYLCYIEANTTQIIGTIYYYIDKQTMHIGPLAVFQKYQDKGIGTYLLNEVEKKSIKSGCHYLNLQVVNARTDLIMFYQRKGFSVLPELGKAEDIGLSKHQLTKSIIVLTYQKDLK